MNFYLNLFREETLTNNGVTVSYELDLLYQKLENKNNAKFKKEFLGEFQIEDLSPEYSEAKFIMDNVLYTVWDKLNNHQKGLYLATNKFKNDLELLRAYYEFMERQKNAAKSKSD